MTAYSQTKIYTETLQGYRPCSVILTRSECRIVYHDRLDDHVVDRFPIKNDRQWWVVYRMLEDVGEAGTGPLFGAAKRRVEGK